MYIVQFAPTDIKQFQIFRNYAFGKMAATFGLLHIIISINLIQDSHDNIWHCYLVYTVQIARKLDTISDCILLYSLLWRTIPINYTT